MHIAILGANSQIAKDLILSFAATGWPADLTLFARRPAEVSEWLSLARLPSSCCVADYSRFDNSGTFDAIINFVGSGNPVHTAAMGSSILQVTQHYDEMVLRWLERHPDCRYIFLSSGAAYGGDFAQPVGDDTPARVPINHMQASDWYGLSKLYAECRHRALPELAIVDVRVFNYFSHTQDIGLRFLITDILRAIATDQTFQTSSENIVRDYLGPQDMHQLISRILNTPAINTVIDCYTRAPVGKLELLTAMQERFGLSYELVNASTGFTATGSKLNYYSTSHKAARCFGYTPERSALDGVVEQSSQFLDDAQHHQADSPRQKSP